MQRMASAAEAQAVVADVATEFHRRDATGRPSGGNYRAINQAENEAISCKESDY